MRPIYYYNRKSPDECSQLTCAECVGACCLYPDAPCYDETSLNGCNYLGGIFYIGKFCADLTEEECPKVSPSPSPMSGQSLRIY